MKRLKFQEILFLSYKEKKARKIKFDPNQTIIIGENGVGKSCIIKSLYYTLGAEPYRIASTWMKANVIYLLKFYIVDEEINSLERYIVIRYGDLFIFYNKDNDIIKRTSNKEELTEFFSNLFDFKIKLPNKMLEVVPLPPAYIYLPFYIDQDNSWVHNWASFKNLRFPNAKSAIISFHTGIRPNLYYESKNEISIINKEIQNIDKEIHETTNFLNKIKLKYADAQFNININEFQKEIKELLVKCEALNSIQHHLKENLNNAYNDKIKVEAQIEIAQSNLKETRGDYDYATNDLKLEVKCPTCGARYSNSFQERFGIANDSDECENILFELNQQKNAIEQNIKDVQNLYLKKKQEFTDIQIILKSKQNGISLEDVINSKAQSQIKNALIDDIENNKFKQGYKLLKLKELNLILRSLDDKNKRKTIEEKFHHYITTYSHLLGLRNTDYIKINSNINESGSKLPRALIAYNYSILNIINEFSTSIFCPITIDAPNQQGQDSENLPKMINFILENQPIDSQLILGVEEFESYKTKGSIINLNNGDTVLQKQYYNEVKEEFELLLNKGLFFN